MRSGSFSTAGVTMILGRSGFIRQGEGTARETKTCVLPSSRFFLRQQLHRPLRAADAPGELRIDQRDIRRGNGRPEQPDAR